MSYFTDGRVPTTFMLKMLSQYTTMIKHWSRVFDGSDFGLWEFSVHFEERKPVKLRVSTHSI